MNLIKKHEVTFIRDVEDKVDRKHGSDTYFPRLILPREMEREMYKNLYLEDLFETEINWNFISSKSPEYLNEEPPKGKGEKLLYDELSKWNDRITLSKKIQLENGYVPDIGLYINAISFWIDIEIDEPYITYPNITPTHYMGSDENWERLINFYDWGILRFTEGQVLEDLQICVKFIYRVLKTLSGFYDPDFELKYKDVPENFKKNGWTKDEGLIMWKQDYRENYNPNYDYIIEVPKRKERINKFCNRFGLSKLFEEEYDRFVELNKLIHIYVIDLDDENICFRITNKYHYLRQTDVTKLIYENFIKSNFENAVLKTYYFDYLKRDQYHGIEVNYDDFEKFHKYLIKIWEDERLKDERLNGDNSIFYKEMCKHTKRRFTD